MKGLEPKDAQRSYLYLLPHVPCVLSVFKSYAATLVLDLEIVFLEHLGSSFAHLPPTSLCGLPLLVVYYQVNIVFCIF